jgi:hypothetical protein
MEFLGIYSIFLLLLFVYHLAIKRKKNELGEIVAEWPARFNLFSLIGIWTYSKLGIALIAALVFAISKDYRASVIILLLVGIALVRDGLLQTVIAAKGIYFNEKLVYWHDIAAYTIDKRARFTYLALQLKVKNTILKIPLKPAEIGKIRNFIESHFTIDRSLENDHSQ